MPNIGEISYLQTWVFLAYVRMLNPKQVKLCSRAYECVCIGNVINRKTLIFYYLGAKVIIESNNVEFNETKFPFKSINSGTYTVLTFKKLGSFLNLDLGLDTL